MYLSISLVSMCERMTREANWALQAWEFEQ